MSTETAASNSATTSPTASFPAAADPSTSPQPPTAGAHAARGVSASVITGGSELGVRTIIVTAMPEEAQPFLDVCPHREVSASLAHQAWVLEAPGGASLLLRSGIGLVAAAAALAAALTELAGAGAAMPELVISAGTTGGLGRQVEVGDVCVSRMLAYTDVDATAFGYAIGQTPGQPAIFDAAPRVTSAAGTPAVLESVRNATPSAGRAGIHVGQMLAGGSFVTAKNVGLTRELFPEAVSTDMESTALAQVAHTAGVPFASVRGVSDLCGPEAGQDFHIGADEAAARSAAAVLAILRELFN